MPRRIFSVTVLLTTLSLSGCHREPAPGPVTEPKKESSSASVETLLGNSSQPAPPPAPNTTPSDTASGTAPATTATGAAGTPSNDPIKILNTAIDYYVLHENRPPKTMQDLMEGGQLKAVPPAPPGMKYVIDRPTLKAKIVKQ